MIFFYTNFYRYNKMALVESRFIIHRPPEIHTPQRSFYKSKKVFLKKGKN